MPAKRAVLSVFLFLASFAAAQTVDSPATPEDVQQLFTAMKVDVEFQHFFHSIIDQSLPAQVAKAMKQDLPGATPDQLKQIDNYAAEIVKNKFANIPVREALQSAIPVYQKHYSHSETQELIKFFSSATGQKFISTESTIFLETRQAISPVLQSWANEQVADLKQESTEFLTHLKEQTRQPAEPPKP